MLNILKNTLFNTLWPDFYNYDVKTVKSLLKKNTSTSCWLFSLITKVLCRDNPSTKCHLGLLQRFRDRQYWSEATRIMQKQFMFLHRLIIQTLSLLDYLNETIPIFAPYLLAPYLLEYDIWLFLFPSRCVKTFSVDSKIKCTERAEDHSGNGLPEVF